MIVVGVVPPIRRMTIGDRALPVAGARVWNALPSFVTDSATVATFKSHLKTYVYTSLRGLFHETGTSYR